VAVRTNLDEIKVSGKWLELPKVTFPAPFAIDKTQAKVVIAGKGAEVTADQPFTFRYYLASGPTGKKLEESFTSKSDFTTTLSGLIKGFQTTLVGKKAGSRVLLAITGPDGYDSQGGSPDGSIKVGDTLVFVVDIVGAAVTQPSGKTTNPPNGLPTVAGGAADKPTVTMPGTAAPTTMSAVSLISGGGAKVAKGDTIYVRYVGYSWKTGKLVDDQWTPNEGLLVNTIPGWQTGLLGKAIGSRVLLVLPPKDGYPQGSNNPPLEAGDTIVYVVDILYSYKATS
jgi:peptidylprolyl isomerase